MNTILKFKQTENSRVYLSSDFHLNHSPKWPIPIWKARGYNSVVEMNDAIIDSINSAIRYTDILFFLGDFVLNCSESQFEEILSRINCQRIYMLFGNHNSCVWSAYQREIHSWLRYNNEGYNSDGGGSVGIDGGDPEIYPLKYRNIIFIGNYAEIHIDGSIFILNHYPLFSWNHMSKGSIHCHGHIHSTKETYIQRGRTIDVGFDYWKRPVAADEIRRMMVNVDIKHEGHH